MDHPDPEFMDWKVKGAKLDAPFYVPKQVHAIFGVMCGRVWFYCRQRVPEHCFLCNRFVNPDLSPHIFEVRKLAELQFDEKEAWAVR